MRKHDRAYVYLAGYTYYARGVHVTGSTIIEYRYPVDSIERSERLLAFLAKQVRVGSAELVLTSLTLLGEPLHKRIAGGRPRLRPAPRMARGMQRRIERTQAIHFA